VREKLHGIEMKNWATNDLSKGNPKRTRGGLKDGAHRLPCGESNKPKHPTQDRKTLLPEQRVGHLNGEKLLKKNTPPKTIACVEETNLLVRITISRSAWIGKSPSKIHQRGIGKWHGDKTGGPTE